MIDALPSAVTYQSDITKCRKLWNNGYCSFPVVWKSAAEIIGERAAQELYAAGETFSARDYEALFAALRGTIEIAIGVVVLDAPEIVRSELRMIFEEAARKAFVSEIVKLDGPRQ